MAPAGHSRKRGVARGGGHVHSPAMAIDPFSTPIPDLRCGFAGGGLDRADHWRKDDAQVAAMRLRPDARWLVLDQLRPLTAPAEDGTPDIAWQRRSMLPADAPEVFLGVAADGAPRFAAACPAADMSGEPMDARAFAALAGEGAAMIDATRLKPHRTAASLLEKGPSLRLGF